MSPLAQLLLALLIFGILSPLAVKHMEGAETWVRIVAAALMIAPLGFFMGMPFPLGMKLALSDAEDLAPWFWGVNGAASVWASVLASLISMEMGISISFFSGIICYAAASGALWIILKKTKTSPLEPVS